MDAPNKIMIASAAILAVVVVVFLIYGITTHTESGFRDGVPKWDRGDFPLDVFAITYGSDRDLDQDHRDAVDHVIDLVNGRLGFNAFKWIDDEPADVVIIVAVPFDSASWEDPGGSARIAHSGGHADRCDVETSNTGTQELLALTIHHELGHCLGLDHDNFRLSIMRPEQEPTPDGRIPPWITDFDRDLLRDLYGPR